MKSQARITVSKPQAIIFLLDQSGSMSEKIVWNGVVMSKADALCGVINATLEEILARCNSFGMLKDYFAISVLGYGGDGVKSLLSREGMITASQLATEVIDRREVTNVRTINGRKAMTRITRKIWITPKCEGVSPMCSAYDRVYEILSPWIHPHRNSQTAPPIVVNITDGEATDAPMERLTRSADRLKSLSTLQGNTILMNIHISNISTQSHLFPHAELSPITDNLVAERLFRLSSVMPESYNHEIAAISPAQPPYRAFACNTQITDLLKLLDISSTSLKFSI